MKQLLLITACILFTLISCVTPTNNEHKPLSFSVLPPSGPFPVGITQFDISRSFGTTRIKTIPIQLWYPAKPDRHNSLAPYNTPEALTLMKQVTIEQHQIPEAKLVKMMSATNNSYLNAAISKKRKKYPVIIFSPGYATPPQSYTALLEDLASHGYLILSITQAAFPPVAENLNMEDAARHQLWEDNLTALVQQLPKLQDKISILKKADLNRLGLAGHSFGGSTSLQVCEQLTECQCVVNIDGYLKAQKKPQQLHKPSFAIMATHYKRSLTSENKQAIEEDKQMETELIELFKKSKHSGPSKYIEIENMHHFSFTDTWLLLPHLAKKEKTLSGDIGITTTRKLLRWFFDNQLKQELRPFPELKPAIIKPLAR